MVLVSANEPLIVRSRVSVWGFVVALVLAGLIGLIGVAALHTAVLPARLGMFVEPPSWLLGALLLGMAAFLALVGVAEFARYLKPAVEVVADADGLSTHGLLGQRRVPWLKLTRQHASGEVLTLEVARGRFLARRPIRIDFSRLDIEPEDLLRRILTARPDLFGVPSPRDSSS